MQSFKGSGLNPVNHRKRHFGKFPVVYFIQANGNGPIKIGFTVDFQKRFSAIQIATYQELVVRCLIPAEHSLEQELLKKFKPLRIGCQNEIKKIAGRGRCWTCYIYFRKNGFDRSQKLIERAKYSKEHNRIEKETP
jgi:hypothetical protein